MKNHLYLLVLLGLLSGSTWAQCPTDNSGISVIDYCPNQYAEYIVDAPSDNVKYQWFESKTGVSRGYTDHYVSSQRYASETGTVYAYFQAEISDVLADVDFSKSTYNVGQYSSAFKTSFSTKNDVHLSSLTIPFFSYYVDPSSKFRVKLSFANKTTGKTYYTDWIYFSKNSLIASASNALYGLDAKVNMDLPAGDYEITAINAADSEADSKSTTLDFAVFSGNIKSSYSSNFTETSISTFTATVNNNTMYGGFYNLKLDITCDKIEVSAEETNTGCCEPVYEVLSITTNTESYVVSSPFTMTLTASGNSDYYYKWYKDGMEIKNSAGIGDDGKYLAITEPGKYSVRAAESKQFIDNVSCYSSEMAWIQERILFIKTEETEVCEGQPTKLVAKGATGDVTWNVPSDVVSDAKKHDMMVTATPTQSMKISVTAEVPVGNQIVNGDFELGYLPNLMTISPYYKYADTTGRVTYVEGGRDKFMPNQGEFTVHTYVYDANGWAQCFDHTTGSGRYFYADAYTAPDANNKPDPTVAYVWQQDVQVVPNTDYEFSAWFTNIYPPSDPTDPWYTSGATLPELMIYVDDEPLLASPFVLEGKTCNWEKVSAVWNSGNHSGTVNLKVSEVSQNGYGNDFGLDDITFGAPAKQSADVFITVKDCLEIEVPENITICAGDTVEIEAQVTGGAFMGWSPATGLQSAMSPKTLAYPTETTEYTASTKLQLGNLVVNSDFESGKDVGYTIPNGILSHYAKNPQTDANNQYYAPISDHTSGSGYMLVFDPSTTDPLYKTTVVVEEGQEYMFSCWVANIIEYGIRVKNNEDTSTLATPLLRFEVDGELLTSFDALRGSNDWVRAYSTWTATKSGQIEISIRNEESAYLGNDFAIDDIEFTPIAGKEKSASFTITVDDCLPDAIDQVLSYCEDLPVGSKKVADIDLSKFEDDIKNEVATNTVTWYLDEAASMVLPASSVKKYTATQGDVLYAQVSDGFAKKVAKVEFKIMDLPKIEFPTIGTFCKGDSDFQIEGVSPEGGVFSGDNITESGLFSPSSVGESEITYTVEHIYLDNLTCKSSESLKLTTYNIPTTDWADVETKYCGTAGVDLKVEAVSGATYKWSGSESTTNISTGAVSGKYSVTLEKDGCSFTTDEIEVVGSEIPTFTLSGGDTYCPSDTKIPLSLEIEGSAPFSLKYKIGSSDEIELSDVKNSSTIDITDAGKYVITELTNAAGCVATDYSSSTIVKFDEIPALEIDPIKAICKDVPTIDISSYVNIGSAVGNISYSVDNGSITSAGVFTHDGVGEYQLTVTFEQTGNICPAVEIAKIVVNDLPSISFSPTEPSVCVNTELKVVANVENGAEPYTYKWSSLDDVISSALALKEITVESASAGKFALACEVVDANACKATESVEVIVNALPTVAIDNVAPLCVDADAVQLVANLSPTGGTAKFSGDGVSDSGLFTPATAGASASAHKIQLDYVDLNACRNSATLDIVVNALPEISISPSKKDVCISGNNSDVVTISINGISSLGDGSFSSTTLSIDAQSGAINPQSNNVGTHNILYNYEDENGCKASTSTSIEIHDLPKVSFSSDNRTKTCIYDSPFELKVAPDATGVFSIGSSTFDPSVGVGEHSIVYKYTDNYSCQNSANHTIDVISVDLPTIISDNPKTIVIDVNNNMTSTADLLAETTTSGADLIWYDADCLSKLSDGASFDSELTSNHIASNEQTKSFYFNVRQQYEGCLSECQKAEIILSRCPALAPKTNDAYYCVDEVGPFTVSATNAGSSTGKLSWFAKHDDTDPIPNFDGVDTYTSSLLTGKKVETEKIYVAEYDATNSCWSSKVEVAINIVENPTVTLSTASLDVCRENGDVQISATPSSGTFTASDAGFDASTRIWNLESTPFTDVAKTLDLQYVYSEKYGVDNHECSTTKNLSIVAHQIEAPVVYDKSWLISDVEHIPSGFLRADKTGASLEWFADLAATNSLSTADAFTPNLESLALEVDGKSQLLKTYYVRQIDDYGCVSALSPVKLSLVKCPYNAPKVESLTACVNDQIDNLKAEAESGVVITKWIWYDNAGMVVSESGNEFAHNVDNSVAGVSNFRVSYMAVEAESGNECESPASDVSITINPLPKVVFDNELPSKICFDEGLLQLNYNVDYNQSSKNKESWSVLSQSENAAQGGFFDPTTYGKLSADYVIELVATDKNSCVGRATHNLRVQYSPKPIIAEHIDRLTVYASAPFVLNANPTDIATKNDINWYDANMKSVGKSSPFTLSESDFEKITGNDLSTEGNYYFYATQTIDGCESDTSQLKAVVRNCPAPAPTVDDVSMCVYSTAVDVEANFGTWKASLSVVEDVNKELRWFTSNSDPLTQQVYKSGQAISIPRADVADGGSKFYVAEYSPRENCYSPLVETKVAIDVVDTFNIVINPSSICEGDNLPIASVNNSSANTIAWFTEKPISVPTTLSPQQGNAYQFETAQVGTNTIWAIADNGHCQSAVFSKSFVEYPRPLPNTFDVEACDYERNVALRGEGSQLNSTLKWFKDTSLSCISSGEQFQPSHGLLKLGENKFFCIEVSEHNCSSFAVEAIYTNKAEPEKPLDAKLVVCEYEQHVPLLEIAVNGNNSVRWFDANNNLLSESFTMQVPDTYLNSGAQTIIYKTTYTKDGCESQQKGQYIVSMVARPDAPKVFVQNNCEGVDNKIFNALEPLYWYEGDDTTSLLDFAQTYISPESKAGTYYFGAVKVANGCRSERTEIVHTIYERPAIAPLEDNVWSCLGSDCVPMEVENIKPSIEIKSYEWLNPRLQTVEALNKTYTPKERDFFAYGNSQFLVIARSVNACVSDTIAINYDYRLKPARPYLLSIGDNVMKSDAIVFCQGNNLSPISVTGSNIVWFDSSRVVIPEAYGSYSLLPDTASLILGERVPFYAVDVVNECVSDTTQIFIRMSELPLASIIGKDRFCEQAAGEIFTIDKYDEGNVYVWNTNDLSDYLPRILNQGRALVLDFSHQGLDTLKLTEITSDECRSTTTKVFAVASKMIPDFDWDLPGSMNKVVFEDLTIQEPIQLLDTAIEVAYSTKWKYGRDNDVFAYQKTYNQRHSLDTVTYEYGKFNVTLEAKNEYGCTESITKEIFVDMKYALFVPSSFSPTSPSAKLREFRPVGFNLIDYEISIYDTWGNLLWYSDKLTPDGSPAEGWNGTYNGDLLEPNTYIWKINATFVDGSEWKGDSKMGKARRFGNIVLIR